MLACILINKEVQVASLWTYTLRDRLERALIKLTMIAWTSTFKLRFHHQQFPSSGCIVNVKLQIQDHHIVCARLSCMINLRVKVAWSFTYGGRAQLIRECARTAQQKTYICERATAAQAPISSGVVFVSRQTFARDVAVYGTMWCGANIPLVAEARVRMHGTVAFFLMRSQVPVLKAYRQFLRIDSQGKDGEAFAMCELIFFK